MKPHGYSDDKLDYQIQDIWLIKKDRTKGRPWCKVINHTTPNTNTVVVNFQDHNVQPNDFYWVAIRQKGQELEPGQNEYMAFIGPIFIENVSQLQQLSTNSVNVIDTPIPRLLNISMLVLFVFVIFSSLYIIIDRSLKKNISKKKRYNEK
jgi:hypothetical protein